MRKMNFEQSKLLDTLPKQFFANLVAKVNKKVSEGVDVINLGILSRVHKNGLPIPRHISIRSFVGCRLLRKQRLNFIMKSMVLVLTRKRK